MRHKTHDLLEDYLHLDIENLRSDQIRSLYQKVSDGEIKPDYFTQMARERKNLKNSGSHMRLLDRHIKAGDARYPSPDWQYNV